MKTLPSKKPSLTREFKCAFPHTLPILAGFLFLGMSYGVIAKTSGLAFYIPILTSIIVFGGSLEFVGVMLLTSAFSPLQTFLVALMVQARHLFYGISMLSKYNSKGLKKFYLIFGMCDESFSINYSAKIPENINQERFMLFITFLNHLYWVTGVSLGALLGSIITFNTKGLEFAMTSMFIVIFLEQILKEKNHLPSAIGLVCSVFALIIFKKDSFLIPSMILILLFLTVFKNKIHAKEEKNDSI